MFLTLKISSSKISAGNFAFENKSWEFYLKMIYFINIYKKIILHFLFVKSK